MGRVMALDVGTKTIGVAVSDPLRMFAQPLLTVARQGVRKDCAVLQALCEEKQIDLLVVGMPLELDGSESRSARLARQVGDHLAELTGLQVLYIDERYSSVEAERRLLEADLSRARRKELIDQGAAIVILESFLRHGDWSQIE